MFWRFFDDDVDVFDDVLQNAKHRAHDASNDVNRPPLVTGQILYEIRAAPFTLIGPKFHLPW